MNKIKIGKVRYNKENPINLSIEQGHQYVDDISDLDTITKEMKKESITDCIYSNNNVSKAIFYWVDKCVEYKRINYTEALFIKLIFKGIAREQLYKIIKDAGIYLKDISDIEKIKDIILKKIEDGIDFIQNICTPIVGNVN